jgi:hypothetical protein
MTRTDALARAGISTIRKVSDSTTVIEYVSGGCRPATATEVKLVEVLLSLTSSG